MLHDNIKCLVCDSKNSRESIYPGYLYKDKKYKKYQCKRCSFIFIDPIPDKGEVREIYNNHAYFDDYFVPNAKGCGYLDSQEAAFGNAEKTLDKIKLYSTGTRLLEIGCAGGFFLRAAKKSGFEVTGIEINKEMVEIARKELGDKVIHGDIMDLELRDARFDIVCMGDVFEHLIDISKITGRIKDILTDRGILLIEGPVAYYKTLYNFLLKLKFFLKRRCYSTNPPTHLWEFTPGNLRLFLERHGFKVLYMELWESSAPDRKVFFKQDKHVFLKSIAWYIKALSGCISNSWFGRIMGLGDRVIIIASKSTF